MALADCFSDDEAPDAPGCTNDEHGHDVLRLVAAAAPAAAVTSSMARSPLSVRG